MSNEKNTLIQQLLEMVQMLESNALTSIEKDILKDSMRKAYVLLNSLPEDWVKERPEVHAKPRITEVNELMLHLPKQDTKSVKTELEERKPETVVQNEPKKKEDVKIEEKTTHEDLIKKVAQSTQKLLQQEVINVSESATDTAIKGNPSVDEKVGQPEQQTVSIEASSIGSPNDLKSNREFIDLNKKFFFVSELFAGDASAYDQMISRLDATSDIQNAKNLLSILKRERPNWASKDHALEVLESVLNKRFGIEE